MAGESWILRVETLLQAVEPEERNRAEKRWWRLRHAFDEPGFDDVCLRLKPADLRDPVSRVDELLSRHDDGWIPSFADAGLFGSC